MADEEHTFKQGGVTFPLPTSLGVGGTGLTVLEDADPAIFHALAFFQAMLEMHVGARWAEAAAVAGLPTAIVAQSMPYDPADYLHTRQFKFPLLAVFRTRERFDQKSTWRDMSAGTWVVQWSLPPLDAAQAEQLTPFLHAVAAVIRRKTVWNYDEQHNGGEMVWEIAGVQSATPIGVTYGAMQGVDGLHFPSAILEIQVDEREMDVPEAFEDIGGMDTSVDLADEESNTIEVVAELATEPDTE